MNSFELGVGISQRFAQLNGIGDIFFDGIDTNATEHGKSRE
jgi:hypothetical protein